jgi:hypothetical protein
MHNAPTRKPTHASKIAAFPLRPFFGSPSSAAFLSGQQEIATSECLLANERYRNGSAEVKQGC